MHKSQMVAKNTAKMNGFDESAPRMIDTEYGDACYLIAPGLVVYEDDPDSVVSIQQRDGRLISA